jgi:site-specific DNA-methyltransferase (adenine-specific)
LLELNKLYNMDCMEGMKQFPDKYFELAIVDPPYGIGASEKNSTNKKQSRKSATNSTDYGNQRWDDGIPTEEYFKELFRVSKQQIIWGVNYYPFDFLTGGRVYWNKCVTMPTYSDGEIAYCSLINSVKSVTIAWHGMIQQDMKNKEIRIHPTQKPVALYEWLLKNYAKPGDKILDTHVGSASSLIACHNMGFEYIGFEIDEDYFKAASERLEAVKAQTRLF